LHLLLQLTPEIGVADSDRCLRPLPYVQQIDSTELSDPTVYYLLAKASIASVGGGRLARASKS
jgi:hypothetical protein